MLYLHQFFVPDDGAGDTRAYDVCRAWVRAGNRVTVITSNSYFPNSEAFGQSLTRLTIDGIDLHIIRVPYTNHFPFWRRIIAFLDYMLRATWEVLQVAEVDLVFVSSPPLTVALTGIVARLWQRCPMIFEVRDLWPEMPIAVGVLRHPLTIASARALERLAYASATRIIAQSPGMREGVLRAGYPAQQVSMIPNSADLDWYRVPAAVGEGFLAEHPHLAGGPLVVYIGTIGVINAVEYLVEIAAEMRLLDPSVRFLVVGDGKHRAQVIERAKVCGVWETSFWWLPQRPRRETVAILSAATVSTSLFQNISAMWHNSANKFFDALAAGRPILINYQGWQADLLRETGAGLVVPPHDAAAAARQLHTFLQDEARQAAARAAAAQLADLRYNRQSLVRETLMLFEEVLHASTHQTGI